MIWKECMTPNTSVLRAAAGFFCCSLSALQLLSWHSFLQLLVFIWPHFTHVTSLKAYKPSQPVCDCGLSRLVIHKDWLDPGKLLIRWLGPSSVSPFLLWREAELFASFQELSVRVMLPASRAVCLRSRGGWEMWIRQERFGVSAGDQLPGAQIKPQPFIYLFIPFSFLPDLHRKDFGKLLISTVSLCADVGSDAELWCWRPWPTFEGWWF